MGLVTVLLRAPFAALGSALGGDLAVYRLGAFACLWVLAAVVLALALELRSLVGAIAVVLLVLLTPPTTTAVTSGHPEELVLAATAVASVWLTALGLSRFGGIAAGLAIGTKPFGVFALLASASTTWSRVRQTVVAGLLVGAVFTLPLPALSPATYRHGSQVLARYKRVFSASVWWPVAEKRELAFSTGQGRETQTLHLMPGGFDRGSGTIAAVLFALLASAAAFLGRRAPLRFDALALLAAMFFARAFFDPENLEYYAAPGFAALVAWEVLARRRIPILSAVALALDYLTFHGGLGRANLQATVYLLWILPLTGYLVAVCTRRR